MTPLPREIWNNPAFAIGREVRVFDLLPSTNDYAKEIADDTTHHGIAIVANEQSAGRGQHGRVWQADGNSSLLLSIILPSFQIPLRPVVLTAWAAVSIIETIREIAGVEARLKWPNDVLIDGKKVCGILIEQGRGTVVGIGLNLNQTQITFNDARLPDATSLQLAGGSIRAYSQRNVLDMLLRQMNVDYQRLLAGDRDSLEKAWVNRIGLIGRRVFVERSDGTSIEGELVTLTFEIIVIEDESGTLVRVKPEAIRHISAA